MASVAAPGTPRHRSRRPARPSRVLAAFGKRRLPVTVNLECTFLTQRLFLPSPRSSLTFQGQRPLRHFLQAGSGAYCVPPTVARVLASKVAGCAVAVPRKLDRGGVASAQPVFMSWVSGPVLGTGQLLNMRRTNGAEMLKFQNLMLCGSAVVERLKLGLF